MADFADLKFVRVIDPRVFSYIPAKLFEQVKGYDFSPEQLAKYGASVMTTPGTYLFVLVDERHVMHGVLWTRIDFVDQTLDVFLLSVQKAYQGDSVLPAVLKFLRELQAQERPKLAKVGVELKKKIRWSTTRPKAYEKVGFKRSKLVMMETIEEEGEQ